MSFILDAVKKSEQQRQQARMEPMQAWHYQPTSSKKNQYWVGIVVGLNSMVLAALFVWVMQPAWLVQLTQPEQSGSEQDFAVTVPQKPIQEMVIDTPVIPKTPVVEPVVDEPLVSAPEIIEPRGGVDQPKSQQEVITPSANQRIRQASQQAGLPDVIPSLESLPESVLMHIPAIGFSSHLYSSSPESRQVVINGQKLYEGDYLNQDLQLLEIREKSVVFQQFQQPFQVVLSRYWVR